MTSRVRVYLRTRWEGKGDWAWPLLGPHGRAVASDGSDSCVLQSGHPASSILCSGIAVPQLPSAVLNPRYTSYLPCRHQLRAFPASSHPLTPFSHTDSSDCLRFMVPYTYYEYCQLNICNSQLLISILLWVKYAYFFYVEVLFSAQL